MNRRGNFEERIDRGIKMVTWLGFIGKMIEFMATKLMGKRIDLSLDQKRKAGRTFVRLHHILLELEEATKDLIQNIDKPMIDGLAREAWLFNLDSDVSRLSNEFLNLTDKLHEVLNIFDPNLSLALSELRYYKFALLVAASHSFKRTSDDEDSVAMIEYQYPDDKMLDISFEEHYRWILSNPDYFKKTYYDDSELEWPQNVLLGSAGAYDLIEEDSVKRGTIEEQREDIERLRRILKLHAEVISQANKRLREFIAVNFSIADVLY